MDCSYYSSTIICVYSGICEYENRLYEAIRKLGNIPTVETDNRSEPLVLAEVALISCVLKRNAAAIRRSDVFKI